MRVNPPTRPKNMSRISIPCDKIPRLGVMPSVSPTVPIAEAVSKRQASKGSFSIILMISPPPKNKVRYIMRMVEAFLAASSSVRRPKKWESPFLRNTAMELAKRTAIVVVFMPPAVEPGEPPISIRIIIMHFPAPESLVRSAVLKPAVLGVMVWNRESRIRSFRGPWVYSKQ